VFGRSSWDKLSNVEVREYGYAENVSGVKIWQNHQQLLALSDPGTDPAHPKRSFRDEGIGETVRKLGSDSSGLSPNHSSVLSIVIFFNDYPNNHHTIQFKYILLSTAV
jgi:hypothetical protein